MTRSQLSDFANYVYNYPSKKLTVIGITGTNGKTTTVNVVNDLLNQKGFKSMCIGTLNTRLTTPESIEIIEMMHDHLNQGGTHFVMEVSSHAIAQNRIEGIDFNIKALTNVTQDHLDYHKTFQNYKQIKYSFIDDQNSICISPNDYKRTKVPDELPLKGGFNRENIQLICHIFEKLGTPLTNSEIDSIKSPPGRFEKIDIKSPFDIYIDYAHTPDGLEVVLKEASMLSRNQKGKLITVFGCGGDRDRKKRPLMGKIAETFSDVVVVTQDNPRTEDMQQIVDDILGGFNNNSVEVINDRYHAIKYAIDIAQENDIVMIAGKGHETVQIIGNENLPFSDKQTVLSLLSK